MSLILLQFCNVSAKHVAQYVQDESSCSACPVVFKHLILLARLPNISAEAETVPVAESRF